MLTPKQLQNLPRGLTDAYSELSEFILRDIARRIAKGAKITDTAEYLMYRAKALGLSTDEITAKIAEINGVSEGAIAELIRSAAEQSDEFDRRMLGETVWSGTPLEENKQLQNVMAAEIKQTHNACENYTQSLGFAERNAGGRVVHSSLGDFLLKQMDSAHMKVVNGATDYNTAIRQACNALAASGVRTVYYDSGHSDRIEVAVRRAVMTSVSQVTQKISEQNAKELGADGWEISAHAGARPSHAIYQGRQYPASRYESIVRPLIEDYNCRHSAFPIILGVSEPVYTEEELQNIDPPPFTYEGRTYTAYEAQQQRRKMERSMRKQKDRCIVADAAGDDETFTAASIKLRRQKDIYEDFCKAADAYTEYERTTVAGYDRRLAAKTGAVTRKQRTFEKAQVRLTDSVNDDIIKSVEIPKDCEYLLKHDNNFSESVGIGEDVIRTIDAALSDNSISHGISRIVVTSKDKMPSKNPKAVFDTNAVDHGYKIVNELFINQDFFSGKSVDELNSIISEYEASGWWKSKTVGDLINHELMHVRINGCGSRERIEAFYDFLSDADTRGFCGLVDRHPDEFMNEAYVVLQHGGTLDDKFMKVYNKFYDEYLA